MGARISPIFIKDLLARTDIINVINSKIQLKKRGNNYYAFCPFHKEKTPSFSVNQEKQFFYCFGCKIHGNIIDFLMNYDHLNFVESIEELATRNNLTIFYEKNNQNNNSLKKLHYRQNLYFLMKKLSKIYQENLYNHINKKPFLYLKKRGLNNEIINQFKIGYSFSGWNTLSNTFIKNKKLMDLLYTSGMLVKNIQGNSHDRFRSRIMFPIHDKYNRIIGFGGRSIDENIFPKYINSPETEIFHKSYQLYGLSKIYKKSGLLSYILVVEGYMDVISLTQFGIKYVVASLGTATTKHHLEILFKKTDKIIFCYDGDIAGKKAAWKTLQLSLPYISDGRQIKFIFLKDNEDPDSVIKKEGKDAFLKKIKNSISFSDFLFTVFTKKIIPYNYETKIKFGRLILPMINKIPGKISQIYMREKLGKKLGFLNDFKLDKLLNQKNIKYNHIISKSKNNIIDIVIALLLQNSKLVTLISISNLNIFKEYKEEKNLALFIELIKICKRHHDLNTGQILELYRNTSSFKCLKKLAFWNHMIKKDKIERVFIDSINKIKNSILEKRHDELVALSRIKKLSIKEQHEVWNLNLTLAKNKISKSKNKLI